jgi:hypothetical protein
VWSGQHFDGTEAFYQIGSSDFRLQGVDNPGSMSNQTNRQVCVYEGYNYTGFYTGLAHPWDWEGLPPRYHSAKVC